MHLEHHDVAVAVLKECVAPFLRVDVHAPQFEHPEAFAIDSNALLHKKCGTGRGGAHRKADNQQGEGGSEQQETAKHADSDRFEEPARSEEHTSELQSRFDLVCRLLLEKKNDICVN